MDKEIYVNISFDDLHPEKWWGAMNDKWLEELSNFKEKWSDIKYTFFTTPNFEWKDENEYISLIKRRMHLLWLRIPLLKFKKQENNKFLISKYPEWIHFIKKQTAESFFEICIHGNTHYQRYVLPHAEFDRLSKEQNLEKIHDAVKIFQTNGIKFTYCFRPPARWVNKTLKESLIENWFKYLSLEPRQTTLSFEKENGIFNIPQNYSIESSTFDNVFQHLQKHNYLLQSKS